MSLIEDEEERARQFRETVIARAHLRDAYEVALVPIDRDHAVAVYEAWEPILDQDRGWEYWPGVVDEEWEAT